MTYGYPSQGTSDRSGLRDAKGQDGACGDGKKDAEGAESLRDGVGEGGDEDSSLSWMEQIS